MIDRCNGACSSGLDFEFTMHFQPTVDLVDRRLHGHEALVRGIAGEPAEEVLRRVNDTNRYAFDQACRARAIELAARLGMEGRLSINFLPNAVYHPETCLRSTLEAARKYGFPLDRITFEFTENERVMDRAHLRDIVATYKRYGFQTALDDFGAGYAGLGLLAEFQPNVLKIDRALLIGINDDPVRQAIVLGLLKTCHCLGISVLAEGVETVEEARWLMDQGVRYFQGFLIARPAPVPLRQENIRFPDL